MALQGELQSLSDILTTYLQSSTCPFRMQYLEADFTSVWAEIVGKTFAKYVKNIALRNGVLHISCSIASIKSELMHSKEAIIQKINNHFQSVIVHKIIIK